MARCRTASTRQAARRRSSEVRAAAHGGARGRACPVRHPIARPSRQVQPAHASCAGPPWSAGACSRSERRCLGSRRQPLLDTRSVGREFRAGLASRGAVPHPQAEGNARRPAGGEGTNPAGRLARSGPPGALGNQGTVPPARSLARRGYPNNFRANRPTRRTEELPGCPHLVGRDLCFLDCREPAHVMGDRPGGSSRRRYATQPSPSRVTVPRIFVAQVPDQCRGVSCRQVRPAPRGVRGRVPARRTRSRGASHHPRTRTYVCSRRLARARYAAFPRRVGQGIRCRTT